MGNGRVEPYARDRFEGKTSSCTIENDVCEKDIDLQKRKLHLTQSCIVTIANVSLTVLQQVSNGTVPQNRAIGHALSCGGAG
jgi:hypothetical protein